MCFKCFRQTAPEQYTLFARVPYIGMQLLLAEYPEVEGGDNSNAVFLIFLETEVLAPSISSETFSMCQYNNVRLPAASVCEDSFVENGNVFSLISKNIRTYV